MKENNKYLVTINQDDIDDIIVTMDEPDYDGTETNINDPEGVYHITAPNEEEAIEAARWLDSLGNDAYCDICDGYDT